jgi:hypothetical protein
VTTKKGTIFGYNFVPGGQIIPKKFFVTEEKKMDGTGAKDKHSSEIVSISRGGTHQPIHNNQKIRQASGGTTRRKASGRQIT